MTFLTGWLDPTSWLAWLGFGGVAGLGLLYAFGLLPLVVQAASVAAEALRPLAKAAGEALAVILRAFGRLLWAGIRDIADSAATILTVVVLVGGFYFAGKLADDVKYAKLDAHYQQCRADLAKAKRKPSAVREPEFKLPWLW